MTSFSATLEIERFFDKRRAAMKNSAFLGLCIALLASGAALGHAKLLSTIPAADAQLTKAPVSLTLTFDESVRLAMLQLTIAGHTIPVAVDRGAAAAAAVTIPLPLLAPGRYEVRWSALTADDGHVVKGNYSFVIR
jgi:methionine-rich copper-binding protein CopC